MSLFQAKLFVYIWLKIIKVNFWKAKLRESWESWNDKTMFRPEKFHIKVIKEKKNVLILQIIALVDANKTWFLKRSDSFKLHLLK